MISQEQRQGIIGAVDKAFDAQISAISDLVRLPSTRGNEASAQDFMAEAMRRRGLDVDRWKINVEDIKHLPGFSPVAVSYDNAWNVVGAHRVARPAGKSLILNGHIDVVPVGPLDRWTRPPFDAYVKDGWLFGRGGGDMKAGLMSCLFAIDALHAIGAKPASDVFVQSVVEEECTGNGALACLQRGYRADAAIIPEPTQAELLTAQVGVMWFKVKVEGDPQHASGAYTAGANAIEKAIALAQALLRLEPVWNDRKHDHAEYHDHPHPIRFNLGRISGGDWASSVPAWCEFDMRIGFYPGQKLEDVRREIEACVMETARADSYLANRPPEIEYNGFQAEGWVLKGGDEPRGLLEKCHAQVFGSALAPQKTSATTDARFFGLYAGIPAFVYGPKCVRPHGFDEAVELESIRRTTQAIALFMADWCGLQTA